MNRAEKRRQRKLAKKELVKKKRVIPTLSASAQRTLNAAMDHHNAGRLSAAETLYRQVLVDQPNQPDALHLLGVLANQSGDHAKSIELISKALAVVPDFAQAHANLGVANKAAGRTKEAFACYRRALEIDPGFIDARFNLANALYSVGRMDEAASSYRQVISANQEFSEAHNNLGNTLKRLGDLEGAKLAYREALRINSSYAEAYNNLGTVLLDGHEPEEAEKNFRKAIAVKPDYTHALNNLGNSLKNQDKFDEAEVCYRKAVSTDPGYSDPLFNLGSLYQERSDLSAAMEFYEKALTIDPSRGDAHYNLGVILEERGDVEGARKRYGTAISLQPEKDGWRIRKARLLPIIPSSEDDIRISRRNLQEEIRILSGRNLEIADPVSEVGATSFYLAYHNQDDKPIIEELSELYHRACPDLEFVSDHCRVPRRKTGNILRIGFISSFFWNHTIGKLSRGLIQHFSRERFEVIVLRPKGRTDQLSAVIDRSADHVVHLKNRLNEDRKRIADERLDVLFYPDIGMDPYTYFLAFSRLAPVQAVSWGHPDTTGIPNVDYLLSSNRLEIESASEHYSEKLVRLENLPTFYERPEKPEKTFTRTDYGLPEEGHLYVCPQALFKFHPTFDEVIGDLLRQDDDGYLILIEDGIGGYWKQLLSDRFGRSIPEVSDRVVFLPRLTNDKFLGLLTVADAVLDIPQFSGGNSSFEAFSMGVPIVTYPQGFMRGRVTAALYDQMGFDTLVANDPANYVELALRLARDLEFRLEMRAAIESNAWKIFERRESTEEIETFFIDAISRVAGH